MVPAWHPDFRNIERLPDTKVVRTSFFLNSLAIFVVGALAIYAGYKEYGLRILRADTADLVSSIQLNKPASDRSITAYKKFKEEEAKITALREFLSAQSFVASDLILELGGTLPSVIHLYSIDCRSNTVTLRGGIDGAADEASGRAVAYVDSLHKNEIITKVFESVSLTNIVRDPGTGKIQFVIDLKLKASTRNLTGGKK